MKRRLHILQRYLALALYGVSTFTITPTVDYMQNVSTPEQITKASWERTGTMLKAAIDKQGGLLCQNSA